MSGANLASSKRSAVGLAVDYRGVLLDLLVPIKDPEARRKHHREYMRRYLADPENRQKHMARIRRNDSRYRREVAKALSQFRSSGCRKCGELTQCCLDAHHRNPAEKDFTLAVAKRRKLALSKVISELAKCICVCANCHRKIHAGIISIE